MTYSKSINLSLFICLTLLLSNQCIAVDRFITIASTTSTANSGLFNYILPKFYSKTGIQVRIVAVGTGKAIELAKRGDADILFVHHPLSEIKFIEDGHGIRRFPVMYNDFIIVGPQNDPAKIKGSKSIENVFKKIAERKFPFASRGDDSGTNKKELSLWKAASINLNYASGNWYRETGGGMGATLNIASGMNAYTLTDRATWLSFKNKGDLKLLFENDEKLFNQYGITLVNPIKFSHIKSKLGQKFIDWIISSEGQETIKEYKIENMPAFFPNAKENG